MFFLGKRSLERLHRVHPRLVACVSIAVTLTTSDFSVGETVRTKERQEALYYGTPKKTWTLNSKHIIQKDGYCHAVDLTPLKVGGGADWEACPIVATAMFAAAKSIGIRIRWGGDWNQNGDSRDEHQRGSYDGPHFEYLGEV
ncbi:M15 family metallopeptidase [Shewanella sp. D64]|uniref:M15 family metallopeptidase n=1 Tax=unclassified Shewanella TaxID=196818 RepID=UPI0022BA2DC4|nr:MULTISPECIES: M15 family metallopeptidase [unclassified Shewanella]MEC4728846.1 M15 family metallopeptidase [Shewanella sp. D64]MEC4740720.1 M15 family metallopeptidase [Shewanella sp. E94]WBJ95321.1 M15 family metallopeptidase [Shewanella sp. MTB7]